MDNKQFARILMLSALLPAGITLAEAIEREHAAEAVPTQAFESQPAVTASAANERNPSIEQAIEGRHFLKVISAEEDADMERHGHSNIAMP